MKRARRGTGGHRLYTRSDLDLLRHVLDLMDGGMSIGRAVALVARGDDAVREPIDGTRDTGPYRDIIQRLFAATESLDEAALDDLATRITTHLDQTEG